MILIWWEYIEICHILEILLQIAHFQADCLVVKAVILVTIPNVPHALMGTVYGFQRHLEDLVSE